jgi:GT2 family glycosyltransferase
MSTIQPEANGGHSGNNELPRVSIIIATKGRRSLAEKAVASVQKTDYPKEKMEIVVVEETNSPLLISSSNVVYHAIPELNLGFGHARNEGLRLARQEIIVFVDDDCSVENDWLKELVAPLLSDDRAAAVAGSVFVPECGAIGQCENILGFPGGGVRYVHESGGRIVPCPTFSTCNCAIRRSAIDEAGAFEDSLVNSGEDQVLSMRIAEKHVLLYNPNARVYHMPRDNFLKVFWWFVRRGKSRVQITPFIRARRHHVVHMVTDSQSIRLAVVIACCALLHISILPVVSGLLALYYASVLWRLRWSRRYYPSFKTFLALPIVKAVMDMGMDVGIIMCLLSRRERR